MSAPPSRTAARPLIAVAAAAALAAGAAGCSGPGGAAADSSPSPTSTAPPVLPPAAQLAGRAVLGKDQYYGASYRFTPADGSPAGSARVERTRGGVRFELSQPGDAANVARTTVVLQTGAGTSFCRLTAAAQGCLAPGTRPPEGVDPRLHNAFTGWLDRLADRSAALSVALTAPPKGVPGSCFSVEGVAASLDPPVDPGLYCFDDVGRITALRFGAGLLTLAGVAAAAPGVTPPAPLVGALPGTAAPSPTPSPTPSTDPSNRSPEGIPSPPVRHSAQPR